MSILYWNVTSRIIIFQCVLFFVLLKGGCGSIIYLKSYKFLVSGVWQMTLQKNCGLTLIIGKNALWGHQKIFIDYLPFKFYFIYTLWRLAKLLQWLPTNLMSLFYSVFCFVKKEKKYFQKLISPFKLIQILYLSGLNMMQGILTKK